MDNYNKSDLEKLKKLLFEDFKHDTHQEDLDISADQAFDDVIDSVKTGKINKILDEQFKKGWSKVGKSKQADFDRYMVLERSLYKLLMLNGLVNYLERYHMPNPHLVDLSKISLSDLIQTIDNIKIQLNKQL